MRTLSIDLETFSTVDLAKSGVYRYTESPDFEILLFGYSVDGSEVFRLLIWPEVNICRMRFTAPF
jgi:hypothetical protein